MLKKLKKVIQNFLKIFNVKLVHVSQNKIFNLSNTIISPISIPYHVNIQPSVVELEFNLGRTNRWFDLCVNSYDPHYFALKKGIEENLSGKDFVKRVSEILEINKKLSVSKNAAEQFGLINPNSKLNKYPFWAEVLPWDICSIDNVVLNTPIEVKKNRSLHNLVIKTNDPNEIMEADYNYSIYSHAEQYEKLLHSIKQHGFVPSDNFGFIHAELLIKKGDYRWKPGKDGNHRTILVAAIGIKKLPVIIDKIIRYEEIDYWPNVINKTFTKTEAKKIFNQIFNASPPKFYSKWIKHCKKLI